MKPTDQKNINKLLKPLFQRTNKLPPVNNVEELVDDSEVTKHKKDIETVHSSYENSIFEIPITEKA